MVNIYLYDVPKGCTCDAVSPSATKWRQNSKRSSIVTRRRNFAIIGGAQEDDGPNRRINNVKEAMMKRAREYPRVMTRAFGATSVPPCTV